MYKGKALPQIGASVTASLLFFPYLSVLLSKSESIPQSYKDYLRIDAYEENGLLPVSGTASLSAESTQTEWSAMTARLSATLTWTMPWQRPPP